MAAPATKPSGLGEIPLDQDLRERSDRGEPVVAALPDGPQAAIFRDIARQVWAQIEGGGQARKAPKIVVES